MPGFAESADSEVSAWRQPVKSRAVNRTDSMPVSDRGQFRVFELADQKISSRFRGSVKLTGGRDSLELIASRCSVCMASLRTQKFVVKTTLNRTEIKEKSR